jgi:purine nucleoside phosphorylase
MNKDIRIGIIGGSGLDEMEALTDMTPVALDTPFGAPSGPTVIKSARRSSISGRIYMGSKNWALSNLSP